jgi:hypothetical protein
MSKKTYDQLTAHDWALVRALRLVAGTTRCYSQEFYKLMDWTYTNIERKTFERMCSELYAELGPVTCN